MNSARLDGQLRKLGYFLARRENSVEGKYWFVGSMHTHNGYNCENLVEVRSLLQALRIKAEEGGSIYHVGGEWLCV